MQRQKVISSNVESIGYDASTRTLEIKFKFGGIYHYSDVPKEIYDNFLKADSKGKFVHTNIKGIYSYVRIK